MVTINKEKIFTIVSDEGAISLIKKIIRYLASLILQVEKLYIFQLELKKSFPTIKSELDLSFRLAKKEDIENMNFDYYGFDKKSKKYCLNRLKKGDKCLFAIYKNEIVGYIWAMNDIIELEGSKSYKLPKNIVYTYNGFVIKKYRGKRIHGAMYTYLLDLFKKEGKQFVLSGVSSTNKSSLKTKNKERGNYKKIAYLYQIKIFGKYFVYIKKKDLENILLPRV